jgi:dGTPase
MSHDFTRDHPDAQATLLPPLALDRQRIVQSAAFRRLQHKTQVFVAPESDHFRTRLTHTLEVAHQARCLAGLLNLSADLAEVVALAHDLGHPPFGHAGEKALNECLRDHGGFEHNRHTLRIVEELEHPYPNFRGLNLTHAVRACLAHHATPFDQVDVHPLQQAEPPPESRVVDLADRLTYALHDLQDALYANLLTVNQLAEAALWRAAYDNPPSAPHAWRSHLRPTIDGIQRRVLEDAARHAPAATLSPEIEAQLAELEQFLLTKVYRSEPLVRADDHARRILAALFEAYCAHPEQLPERFHRRLRTESTHRVVTDYVAGMTDRYCVQDLARVSDLA